MPITSAGIGSGLDVNSIVQQLLTIERQPIRQLQSEAGRLQTQISAFGKLQSTFSTLRDASAALGKAQTWGAAKASSSDNAVVGTTTTGSARAGNYTISVGSLAAAQTLSSATLAAPTSTLGSGLLRIELGNFDGAPEPKAGASAVEVLISPAESSLADIRDKINDAGAGVQASIVTDVSGSRLVLRSEQTGLENGFRVQVLMDDDGQGSDASGLSALGFDPSAGITTLSRPLAAANAVATVNGVRVESATNTLEGAADGLALTLRKAGATAEVHVEPDTDALKKSVDEFVKAYNESIRLLREQTRYDPSTKVAGPLQGDRSGSAMLGQLRGIFTGPSTASASFSRLADAGLNLDTDGLIKVDSAKLDAALAKGPEMQKLFGRIDAGNAANQGFAGRFEGWLKQSLDSDGTLESRTQSLQARVRNNSQAQERMEDRVSRTEQRLMRQYSALDTRMGQLTGLASYVNQQVTLLNKNSGR